jgi:transposase-like protein
LKDIILEIQKLTTADRLEKFFAKSIASYTASEPIFKEVSELKYKDELTCSYCHSNNAARFGKNNVKMGSGTFERQRKRNFKDCGKTFTDVTNTPLHGIHLSDKWVEFVQCMIEGYSLRKSSELLEVHYTTLFYWRA